MADRPILFSGPMVRALLEGRKTQTRRVLKPQPPSNEYGDPYNGKLFGPEWYEPAVTDQHGDEAPGKPVFGVYDPDGEFGIKVPYAPGDRLWVRESCNTTWADNGGVLYRADAGSARAAGYATEPKWTPSIHMPRRASRLTLTVTDVRVQRLQDISVDDERAEGVDTSKDAYDRLWDSLNAKRDGGKYAWAKNPWVVAVTFEVHKLNIDQMGENHG